MSVIQQIYDSALATAIRESDNLFPILQTFHILGTIALAGAIAIVDLRLLNVAFRREAPATLASSLLPITWVGFAIMAVSGGLLFIAQSAKIYENVFLRAKLLLMVLAIANVILFHSTTYRDIQAWSGTVSPPPSARVFALLSLILWTAVIVTGRFIAYF
ncbi:MAG: DUF6644 family protein [Gammaproteobacteria bacterium]